ncbi:hypothetical protein GSI_07341 [Ganoderma sinense ZZ0214-1]|uniref:Uncharacterized protein n=1 Tax=Ganoderma sinense ZZ0214-1 TaxID=1077348 RepID=A0A2G8SA41_9APHY|nr:hypothetical protein GSI_07341 [Ganoderma sinense ZZ0214-1]
MDGPSFSDRQILVTAFKGRGKIKRLPITYMDLLISLKRFFTRCLSRSVYDGAPPGIRAPCAGAGEGRFSLYALRLMFMGICAGIRGCFDLDTELDSVQPKKGSGDEADPDVGVAPSTPAPADDASSSSTSTSIPGPPAMFGTNLNQDDDGENTPPWASTLPVTCAFAQNYSAMSTLSRCKLNDVR